MAMSRSIGGNSLMTLSSIRIRPDVIDSSPATILNVVVLPQPEGPTRTMNSLSRISRLTSFTAWKPLSYFLFSSRIETLATLAFDGAGEAGHVILDEEGI